MKSLRERLEKKISIMEADSALEVVKEWLEDSKQQDWQLGDIFFNEAVDILMRKIDEPTTIHIERK